MVFIFLILSFAFLALWIGRREWSIGIAILGLIAAIVLFKFLATDILQIMW